MKIALIITAAGTSQRYGKPKLFETVNGKTVLEHTLEAFKGFPAHETIITTTSDHIQDVSQVTEATVIEGGSTRDESVRKAVDSIQDSDVVFIHDGARPNVSQDLLDRLLKAIKTSKAVAPGIGVTDTVKWVDNGVIEKTIDRTHLVRIQTPQVFELNTLKNAYNQSIDNATDEAMLVENMGQNVHVVEGDEENIKITYPKDLDYFGWLLSRK